MDDFQELFKEQVEKTEIRKRKEINQNSVNNNTNQTNNSFLPTNAQINNIESSLQANQTSYNIDENSLHGPLYDFDYKVVLLNKFEEGLMDNYLSGINNFL